ARLFLRHHPSYTGSMNYLEWLYRVSEEDTDRFEPAVINLAIVARAGVPVPAGFIVSKKLVADYFATPTLKNSFQKLFKGVSTARPALFAGVAKEARSLILKKTLSSESRDLLKAYLAELQTRLLHSKNSSLPLLLTGM